MMPVILWCLFFWMPFSVQVSKSIPLYYRIGGAAEQSVEAPEEVERAMCSITTDQIKATANATITRELRGVCHAKEVREQLRNTELNIIREIHRVLKAVSLASHHRQRSVVFRYLPDKP